MPVNPTDLGLDDFQKKAERTSGFKGFTITDATEPHDPHARERLLCAVLGLSGEAGECADLVKKWLGHGHALNLQKLDEEVGDLLYYIAEYASCRGRNLSDLARDNNSKLERRYPQGFSSHASIYRTE